MSWLSGYGLMPRNSNNVVTAELSGITKVFTCAQWAMLALDKGGWVEVSNTCGSIAESIWTPFATNTIEAESSALGGLELKGGTISYDDIIARVINFADMNFAVSAIDIDNSLIIIEQGKVLDPSEYVVDAVANTATLNYDPIEFAIYRVVYFKKQ